MFYTYILKSKSSGRFYIGQTDNLEMRIKRHNENTVKSTKNRGPWDLVHCESHFTRSEALIRERYLKSLKSKIAIEQLITDKISEL